MNLDITFVISDKYNKIVKFQGKYLANGQNTSLLKYRNEPLPLRFLY